MYIFIHLSYRKNGKIKEKFFEIKRKNVEKI